jgi:sarcosine oxidase subunit alpha
LAERAALTDANRPTLVGLRPVDTSRRLTAGSHLVRQGARAVAAESQGHITSVCFSPACNQWIGLGLLERGADRIGEIIAAVSPVRGTRMDLVVASPVFVDPDGGRLRG